MKIALFCGGPSSEHEVSILSTQSILQHIDRKKYDVSIFYITKDLRSAHFNPENRLIIPTDTASYHSLLDGIERNLTQIDLAFLGGIHGEFAEDGRLQAILDFFDIPYSGSDYAASALAMDKYRSTAYIVSQLPIRTPRTFYVDISVNIQNPFHAYPVILKPNNLGSSVGVVIATSSEELEIEAQKLLEEQHLKKALIQEYISHAVELSCSCLESKEGTFTQLPPIEIKPQKGDFFDYDSKYERGGSIEIVPPQSVSAAISRRISGLACDIHQLLGCKTYTRSDFLVRGKEIYYLETNTLPGMTATSLLPQEAQAAGISFKDLITFLIEHN
ncbi:hypothetical protein A3I56_04650 [Candidatus Roizmanbacteria bacterium RIFCSPLOWO2_02_FULL_43_10]|uniref:D-alanine--D-alanine ligase n=1 Tax=Candidatus Roizmanbacteria bacterium RIFCSPLOWO2_02_FULL_43_10 TaxID=1802078 RepID=A0A1F7JTH6_9BACT|nr:MAG: hypothetical protein A3I56_04650 [Candidatus Roizmanbacteria bacterium RIFCSPLOWO2_02_FULL_43_10]